MMENAMVCNSAGEHKQVDTNIARLAEEITHADAIVIGAGSGLSTSAGFVYTGKPFDILFGDFASRYRFSDMYSGGFYPYTSLEEHWGFWSRYIYYNRYMPAPRQTYDMLFDLVKDYDYFVLTTNVDHQFQKAGFDKHRLFYTQGDYGLWQCSVPCHAKTYDNEEVVRQMVQQQQDRRVPHELVPMCPVCGKPMSMNLRADATFVEDTGWHEASARYEDFIHRHEGMHILFLELGVGMNTPGIVKYSFWRMVYSNENAVYACLNMGQAGAPREIKDRSICIDGDIHETLQEAGELIFSHRMPKSFVNSEQNVENLAGKNAQIVVDMMGKGC